MSPGNPRKVMGSHGEVTRKSLGSHQEVTKKSSGSHWGVTRGSPVGGWSPGGHCEGSVRTNNQYVSVSANISVYRPIIGFTDMGKSLSVSVIGISRYRMPYLQPHRYTNKLQSEVNSAGTRWRFYSKKRSNQKQKSPRRAEK